MCAASSSINNFQDSSHGKAWKKSCHGKVMESGQKSKSWKLKIF